MSAFVRRLPCLLSQAPRSHFRAHPCALILAIRSAFERLRIPETLCKTWRRGRDSNPRYVSVYTISSRTPSASRAPLRAGLNCHTAIFLKDEGGTISSFPGLDPSASLQGFAPAVQIQFSLSCENCRTLDTFPYIRFRDVPLRPLGHLSVLAELPIQFCHSERSEESRVFEAD